MHLESLVILNYKNIEEANLTFSPKINCFIGKNGMGKTNLLDAIYFLSFCKSHSNFIDSQNIYHQADFFLLQGRYQVDENIEEIYCGLKRNQKKQFKRNKKEYERLSDHIGLLPLVMISPEDISLISGGSEERRKFIDGVISQYDKNYLHSLLRYNNALRQRNALLKVDSYVEDSLFEIWEEQMAQYGNYLFEQRRLFIEKMIPVFEKYYHYLSNGKESIQLNYLSHHQQYDIKIRLKETREKDKILGYSTQGIHKDELEMLLDGYPIKRVASQGQNKTFLISLKLAQFHFLSHTHQQFPILLLDDIFDKLDTDRVKRILELVSQESFGQIFITDTDREHLNQILSQLQQETKIFKVENGTIC